ncbi:asparagine synthase C-terminal domain-containing protein [Endozoicomonas lisbonensis]
MNVYLRNNQGFKWHKSKGVSVKGYAWLEDDSYLTGKEFCEYVHSIENIEEINKNLNGCYSCVVESESKTLVISDQTRSFPLFYAEESSGLLVSDDANFLRSKLMAEEIDKTSVLEFSQTGYVTGSHTLIKNIKQLQAAEILEFSNTGELDKQKKDILNIHRDFYCETEIKLLERMDSVYQSVFSKLIKSLNDKTVVVPLSGGYDSRLIVVMLKRLGYEKVICFTYGASDNKESKISKLTADALGYEWFFVPYTKVMWDHCYESKNFRNYERNASNLTSVALLQDWPAVQYLKANKLVPDDAVFIPGHTGDFIAGGHIPKFLFHKETLTRNEIVQCIYKTHYGLIRRSEKYLSMNFSSRLNSLLTNKNKFTRDEAVDEFERWNWKERQAKFIINSTRVYEWFGYQWRLPLWDKKIVNIWSKIDTEKRFRRSFYKKYDNYIANKMSSKLPAITGNNIEYNKIYKIINKLKSIYNQDDNLGISSSKLEFFIYRLKMKALGKANI